MLDTPIALIAFKRPDVTHRVLQAIREAGAKRLFIIADGPRSGNSAEIRLVRDTREVLSCIDWECQVTRIYAEDNLGLRKRVLTGLDEVFSEVDRAIILEDDCLPNQDFFQFASQLLGHYQDNHDVGLVSANNFAPNPKLRTSYYFSTHANIWGWGTWRHTWQEFRDNPPALPLDDLRKRALKRRMPGVFRSRVFSRLTDAAADLDSWAIEFAVSCHLHDKLVIVPKVNLVKNIGFGQNSTHTKFESYVDEVDSQCLEFPLKHPGEVSPSFKEMRRESRRRALRWLTFPLCHPLEFSKRLIRFSKLILKESRNR